MTGAADAVAVGPRDAPDGEQVPGGEAAAGGAAGAAPSASQPRGAPADADVLRLAGTDRAALATLLARYGLTLVLIPPGEEIPGSYWGESEAGLVGERLFARPDTPVHSVVHEAGHYVCMSPERRAGLNRDAGGDDAEESAVCCLQLLLADELPSVGSERLMADMDAWGYSFRLGSTRAWFEGDAGDARDWLRAQGVTDGQGRLTGRLR